MLCNKHLSATEDALYVLGKKWTLRIMIALLSGHTRFNELQRTIMIGGYIELPVIKKLTWDYRIMFGGISVSSPKWKITERASSGYYSYREHSGSAFSFGLVTGTGFKYDVIKSLCLMVNADMFLATPEFTVIQSHTYSNGLSDYSTTTFKQPIRTYNFSAGIGFRL